MKSLFKFIFLIFFCCFYFMAIAQNTDSTQINSSSEKKSNLVNWYGSVSSSFNVYGVSGIPQRSNPFFWNVTGNFGLRLKGGIDLPFSYTLGKQQLDFQRPFFQFGMSPKWKFLTLHLGYRNLTYSNYTLNGHTFLGAAIEINTGKFRFSAMNGIFNSDLPQQEVKDLAFPRYKRQGYAIKVGYGSTQNFVDLVFFKAKDDSTSIFRPTDSTGVTPAENLALGLVGKLTIFKKLTLDTDVGVSFFTRDLASTSFRNFEYTIVNPKASSRISYAGKIGLSWRAKSYSLKLDYERVMPEYQTLGAYFFANDMERISLTPFLSLAKNKILVNGTIGIMRNNLLNTRSETTWRTIGNLNINLLPKPHYGINFNYTNNTNNQQEGNVPLSDSLRIRNTVQSISISPFYNIMKDTSQIHTISLSAVYQQVNDYSIFTQGFTNMKALVFSLNHSTQYMQSGFSFMSGLNFNRVEVANLENLLYGFTLGTGKSIFKKTLQLNIDASYNQSIVDKIADGSVIQSNFTASTTIKKRHTFSLNSSVIANSSKSFQDFQEFRGGFSYVLRFK